MFVSKAVFESLCFGAIGVSESPDGSLAPVRFTQKQLEFYRRSESDRIRSLASAGVSLCVKTDAERLRFQYALSPGSSQDIYGFDLYVNSQLFFHMQDSISLQPHGKIDISLPEGTKELKLFFPNLAITNLNGLELCHASFGKPIEAKKWLLLGDSIIQGYTTHFPSMTLSNLLSQRLNVNVLNQGVAGEVFNADMLGAPEGFSPDRVVIAYGTNDWNLRSKDEFERAADLFVHSVCNIWPEVPVALISPIWRADADTPRSDGFAFKHVYEALSKTAVLYKNVSIISGVDLMPPVKELYSDSAVHPNELGFSIYTSRLIDALKTVDFIKT